MRTRRAAPAEGEVAWLLPERARPYSIVSAQDDRAAWVKAGRADEHLALQATALEIRNALISQPIEVRSLRPQFESWLGLKGEKALLMVRIGRAALAPYSLRRPMDDLIGDS